MFKPSAPPRRKITNSVWCWSPFPVIKLCASAISTPLECGASHDQCQASIRIMVRLPFLGRGFAAKEMSHQTVVTARVRDQFRAVDACACNLVLAQGNRKI